MFNIAYVFTCYCFIHYDFILLKAKGTLYDKIKHSTTPKEYINGLGNTIIRNDESFKLEWDTGNPEIICYYNDQVKHDSANTPTRYISFGIENQKIFQEVKAFLADEKGMYIM